jgi:hypothetical protein
VEAPGAIAALLVALTTHVQTAGGPAWRRGAPSRSSYTISGCLSEPECSVRSAIQQSEKNPKKDRQNCLIVLRGNELTSRDTNKGA